jgi:hypothetical protein
MKLYIAVFLILPVAFSCKKNSPRQAFTDVSGVEEIIIDTKNGKVISIDSFIQKVEYVKLETTDDNLLGEISQILIKDSLLIVVDGRVARSIQVYNLKGDFLYKIGSIGNGPGEYVKITNVCLVPGTDQISVLDGPMHKEIIYDINGDYISSHRTPFMLYYFEYLESGNKAYEVSGMRDPSVGDLVNNPLIVTDGDDRILYGACHDFSSEEFSFTMHRPLRKIGEDVYFAPNFVNTIYIVGDTIVKAKYHINLLENGMPSFENMTNKRFEEYRNKYYFFNGDFIELSDYTYIMIMTSWGYFPAVYYHKQRETFLSSGSGVHPFYTFMGELPLARYNDNCMIMATLAFRIMGHKEYLYKDDTYHELLDTLFEGLTEDSNPVLFFYYFKTEEEK